MSRFISVLLLSIQPLIGYCKTEDTLVHADSVNPNWFARNHLSYRVYAEVFYAYDLANPGNHVRQPFFYSYNRHNEFNLNLGLVKLAYLHKRLKANLGLMAGTYVNENLSQEVGVLKNVYEANLAYQLKSNSNWWVEAGIFNSHIGFESAIGSDCWTLTRSILADNSPYYEAGLKFSYTSKNEKWYASGMLLNGWQKIYRQNGNNTPAFGHQLTYKPTVKITMNSSSFVGSDLPDSMRCMRYFHNFYALFELSNKWGLTLGIDAGIQQQHKGSETYNSWYAPICLVKYKATNNWSLTARAEYYSDAQGVIISTGTTHGFQTWGCSVNSDLKLGDFGLWRLEARALTSKDPIFSMNKQGSHANYFFTTSFLIDLN